MSPTSPERTPTSNRVGDAGTTADHDNSSYHHSSVSGRTNRTRTREWSAKTGSTSHLRSIGRALKPNELRKATRELYEEVITPFAAPMTAEDIYKKEREVSRSRFEELCQGSESQRLSVAFSGGGVRAAAFDAGVLWRLAERGRLRDVEHLSLVSGSAYVGTAFMTFLLDTPSCHPSQLDHMYLRAVYETIDRMQHNAGFYVRFSRRLWTRKGARPPLKGLALLLAVMLFAILLVPLTHFMYVAAPVALVIDTQAGAALRLAWCSDSKGELWDWTWGRFWNMLVILVVAAASQAVARSVHRRTESTSRCGHISLFLLEACNVLLLLAAAIALVIALAWSTLLMQFVGNGWKQEECRGGGKLVAAAAAQALARNVSGLVPRSARRCVDELPGGGLWHTRLHSNFDSDETTAPLGPSVWWVWLLLNAVVAAAGILGSQLRWGFLVFRSHHILACLSPLWALFVLSAVTQWRVFGPLYHEDFEEEWGHWTAVVLCIAMVLLPVYGPLRRVVHIFYKRSLRTAFYSHGEDVPLRCAMDSPLCPNLIVSATLVDYCRLCDLDKPNNHFSEFFFTSAYMGGVRTGFISTPDQLSASKVMAISGAATDAFLMTKLNRVWVRTTFLALFNLFMGDTIVFSSSERKGCIFTELQAAPVCIVFLLFFGAMFLLHNVAIGEEDDACDRFSTIFWAAWSVLAVLIAASFFAFHRSCRWLLSSPLIRHIHTAVMHYHTSPEPPLRLFLNDGGLIECLGLISLLRRRCRWMLVTDATADFRMELICLRDSMRMAQDERICSFFDPLNPCRGVEPLLDDFAQSSDTFLRIGVLYDCWSGGDGEGRGGAQSRGEVLFIRMRLLDRSTRVTSQRIAEAEVVHGAPPQAGPDDESGVASMLQHDLGGCCCDCCHTSCNCGVMGRFPDISTGNQFLTPTQFALLCRLGYELSAEAVDHITRGQAQQHDAAEGRAGNGSAQPACGACPVAAPEIGDDLAPLPAIDPEHALAGDTGPSPQASTCTPRISTDLPKLGPKRAPRGDVDMLPKGGSAASLESELKGRL